MKKIILRSGLCAILFASFSAAAQEDGFNKWSIEGQFGVNRAFSPFAAGYDTPSAGLFHAGLGTRFMPNNKFGIMVDFGMDQFKNKKNTTAFTSNYYRGSIQGVMNLSNVLGFYQWTKTVGLLFHAGAGYSMLMGKNSSDIDNIGNVITGITPQFRISDRFSLNLDFTMINNIRQSRTFDFSAKTVKRGFEGQILTGAVGFSIYLGKNQKHADWHQPIDPLKKTVDSLKQAMNTLEEKVNTIEEKVNTLDTKVTKIEMDLQDSDSDGVADKFDLEPNSAPDAKVDTKGRQVKEVVLGNQSLDSLQGLFFTVQLGVYSQEVPSEVMKNIKPLDTKTMPDGKIRYFSGIYSSQEEAAVKLDEAKKAGISDAFMTAYFRGSRITLVEAKTFLQELGPGILQKR